MRHIEQKVVRTYRKDYTGTTSNLSALLEQGYVVVHITPFVIGGNTEYVEYIVERHVSPLDKFDNPEYPG